jgi:hypothetical protein
MAFPLYSAVLQEENAFEGESTIEVEEGLVVVVRDIDAVLPAESLCVLSFYAQPSLASFWEVSQDLSTGVYYSWRGRQVFTAGNGWTAQASEECSFRVSGYVLQAP